MSRARSLVRTLILVCTALLTTAACGASDIPAKTPPAADAQARDPGRLHMAEEAARAMERHAKAAARRSKDAVGDLSQRTALAILHLVDKADGAAQRAARRWKEELKLARGDAREDVERAQRKVQDAARMSAEALARAKEAVQASARRGQQDAEHAATVAREAVARAEVAAAEAARAAHDAVGKALKRSEQPP